MVPRVDPALDLAGKRIVAGVCGGIAAYKAVEVARRLTQAGAEVRVVMTRAATEFVGPLTFSTLTGHVVVSDLFPEPAPGEIVHTSLGRWAELIVVAPATADLIARYALGLASDVLSALLLATRATVVMAPAMHTEMWENEATSRNVATLRARGVVFVGPATGDLAGPDQGVGRLAESQEILDAVEGADVVVMAAAVADWRPADPAGRKLQKGDGPPAITLEPTEDILRALSARRHAGQVLVGFAAETEDVEGRSRAKLVAKGV